MTAGEDTDGEIVAKKEFDYCEVSWWRGWVSGRMGEGRRGGKEGGRGKGDGVKREMKKKPAWQATCKGVH